MSTTKVHTPWPGLIEAYRDRLPVAADWTPVTLLEGGTPLVYAPRLSEKTGCTVHLKYEGLNPTGSFKDRGMTMAVSKAAEEGMKTVICASTGNTSASAAAYAARAGMKCVVVIPGWARSRSGSWRRRSCTERPGPADRRELRRGR